MHSQQRAEPVERRRASGGEKRRKVRRIEGKRADGVGGAAGDDSTRLARGWRDGLREYLSCSERTQTGANFQRSVMDGGSENCCTIESAT
jgi:hypothetical protein